MAKSIGDHLTMEAWVELNYRLGKDLSLHGAAGHLLGVGGGDPGRVKEEVIEQ